MVAYLFNKDFFYNSIAFDVLFTCYYAPRACGFSVKVVFLAWLKP